MPRRQCDLRILIGHLKIVRRSVPETARWWMGEKKDKEGRCVGRELSVRADD